MTVPVHLRAAMSALTPRERAALVTNVEQAAEKWRDLLPRVADVWAAMGAELREVEQLQRARRAAEVDQRHTIRPATKGRA
jgi:hypothetical protein